MMQFYHHRKSGGLFAWGCNTGLFCPLALIRLQPSAVMPILIQYLKKNQNSKSSRKSQIVFILCIIINISLARATKLAYSLK